MSRNQDFLEGIFKIDHPGDDRTEYFHGLGKNSIGTSSGAHVIVKHPKSYTRYYDRNAWNEPHSPSEIDSWARREADENGNVPLFKQFHTPPIFDYAMSTADAKVSATKLGLHAIADTERRFGERPVASSSTSPHSTPTVNTAIKHGIISGVEGQPKGTLAAVGNDINWEDAHSAIQNTQRRVKEMVKEDYRVEPVSEDTVNSDAKSLLNEAKSNINEKKASIAAEKPSRLGELVQGVRESRPKQLEFDF